MERSDAFNVAWLDLFGKGNFVDAFLLKKYYLESFLSDGGLEFLSIDQLVEKVKALVWLGNLEAASVILETVPVSELQKKELSVFNIVKKNLDILLGYSGGDSSRNSKFLVVGPSPLNESLVGQNLVFDYLISFNRSGFDYYKQSRDIAYRSHFAYCSGQFYKLNFFDVNNDIAMGYMDGAVVNGFRSDKYSLYLDGLSKTRIRAPYPFLLSQGGALLGVSRALYDAIYIGAKDITVLNADLYVDYPFHVPGYPVSFSNRHELAKSWAIHDIFFNFNFSKMLVGNNRIFHTTRFKEVLDLDVLDYIRALESVFLKI
jgi:hypothetical protein